MLNGKPSARGGVNPRIQGLDRKNGTLRDSPQRLVVRPCTSDLFDSLPLRSRHQVRRERIVLLPEEVGAGGLRTGSRSI